MKNISSTKFILSIIILTIATILCIYHFIDGGQWVMAVTILAGLYETANVLEKQVTK